MELGVGGGKDENWAREEWSVFLRWRNVLGMGVVTCFENCFTVPAEQLVIVSKGREGY